VADIPAILTRSKDAGHTIFTRGAWNLNIIGVRSAARKANVFDDQMHVAFKDETGQWVNLSFECTTDPGAYWLAKPMQVTGTAIMAPGQYRGSHKIGKHRGKYTALVQTGGRVSYFRDNDKDEILDMEPGTEQSGYIGLNLHKAGSDSTSVDRWSAGCQVIANSLEFDIFMALVQKSASLYGDTFTYTLLED